MRLALVVRLAPAALLVAATVVPAEEWTVASPDGRDGSLTIHQDARLYLATLQTGERLSHDLATGRHAWLQVLQGTVTVEGQTLTAGDGLAVSAEPGVALLATGPAEVLLFDLA